MPAESASHQHDTAPVTPSSPSVAMSRPEIGAAVRATYAAFIAAGVVMASWASRIPQIRDQLDLTPSRLGWVLFAIAAGSIVSLPLAGLIVHRFNSRRTVARMALLLAVGLATAAVGALGSVPVVVAGFFLLGFANGAWDVAMNVQAATVEQQLGRSIMSRFHAGFSIGTVVGALVGVVMVALGVPVTAHLIAVAALTAFSVPMAVRGFVPDPEVVLGLDAPAHTRALVRWAEPRTLLIGVFVLAFAFAEGTANDWIAVALIDGYDATAAVGTLGFATFLMAMTGARWFGSGLLDRYGRVVVLRLMAVLAAAGLALFVYGPSVPFAFFGALLWGAGAALGFPVGMSAAADDAAAAAGRVSVVASIGYCAFLAGPPLIGLVGSHISVLRALTVVAVLLALAAVVAGSLRPLTPSIEPGAEPEGAPEPGALGGVDALPRS